MNKTRTTVYKFIGFCIVFGGLAFWLMNAFGTI